MDRVYRKTENSILGGVCGGMAEKYDLDPGLVRILAFMLILSGVTPLLYLVAWAILPTKKELESREKIKDVEAREVD